MSESDPKATPEDLQQVEQLQKAYAAMKEEMKKANQSGLLKLKLQN